MEQRMETLYEKEKMISAINKADNIVIFHHIKPDGDCLGSSQALLRILREAYPKKNVYAIGNSYSSFEWLDFDFTDINDVDFDNSLAIVCDVSGSNRVEDFAHVKKCTNDILRIDHHPTASDYATITALFTNRPATCQIIAELANEFDWVISREAATLLYLGIITDSGRFLFRSVTDKTFEITAHLIKIGANREMIHANLYKKDEDMIKFECEVLTNYKKSDNGQVIYFIVDKDMQQRYKLHPDQCVKVNILANISNYKAWLFFIENDDNYRTEFRCGPNYKINKIAFKHGGGGHDQASGCIATDLEHIKQIIEDVAGL